MPERAPTKEEQSLIDDYAALRKLYEEDLEDMLIEIDEALFLGRVALLYYVDYPTARLAKCRTFSTQAAALHYVHQFLSDQVYYLPMCCIGGTAEITSVFE